MTDQQPHTPYIEDGWLVEPCEPDYVPGISQPIPGSWSKPIVNLAELDGYDELIAAAEQRGAERVERAIRERHVPNDEGVCIACLLRFAPCPTLADAQEITNTYRADRTTDAMEADHAE